MATGVTRDYSKKHTTGMNGADPGFSNTDPFPLPTESQWPTLGYSEKVSLEALHTLPARKFIDCSSGSEVRTVHTNTLMFSENCFGMLKLLEKYAGKVSLICVDPPYCTGFDFHGRDMEHAYKDQLHPAAYLEFMRRRFLLMRELLSEEGSLYVHIGHQMLFHLKVILDEVFPSTFRNLIVRRKCSSKNSTRKQYPNLHDYILFYTKSKSYIWHQPGQKADAAWIDREYPKTDARGRYKLVPVHAPGIRNGETGQTWRGKLPPPGKHWQLKPTKLEVLDTEGEIHWSRNGNPRRKVRLSKEKSIPLTDYWPDFKDAHHQSIPITGYPTEKNFNMLCTLVQASSNPGDIVCDAFSGSGTTIHAATVLKRRWIGIDSSLTAIAATVKRLQQGLKPMGDFVERKGAQMAFPDLSFAEEASQKHTAIPFELIAESEFYAKHRRELRRLLCAE
ncbi:MAG: adenine-specific DNA-methyltransferase [Chthoniobacter sp.]|jgi:adenine-specific DNA-methyltransferase|nr:adenine-specific DNA-methyltransferase [Chthoniobacter sp.]